MATTRTGNYGIGFRRGWSDWQRDLASLIGWAGQNDFVAIDVGPDLDAAKQIIDAGLAVGSIDLPAWKDMISPDKAKRDAAVEQCGAFVASAAEIGVTRFFCVMLPEDPGKPRKENFDFMVDSFGRLLPVMEEAGGMLVIEGYPGPGALCCTPETCRAFIEAVESPAAGINFDPSHLLRMGIDPVLFLNEFVDRVGHVHAKDTEIMAERQYELGTEQPATFAEEIRFGGGHWRYTLPGHGLTRWAEVMAILEDANYDGKVCIELEDANFNGTTEGEQLGLLASKAFLESC